MIKRVLLFSFLICLQQLSAQSYKIVDTGQKLFYNNRAEIASPSPGDAFYGQDAQFAGHQPTYRDNDDGTVTDLVTGLMWSKSPDLNGDGVINAEDKLSYTNALASADTLSLAGYDDWRLPSIKEQYSLIMFYGLDPSGYNGSTEGLVPFINTDYFAFGYGDESAGERIIDAQFATSTKYVSTTMNDNETMFGVNFADGRIKGYPSGPMPGRTEDKGFYVFYVRGNPDYGKNDFIDNQDGTITDRATGLMWQQGDSQAGMHWKEALEWVQQKNAENFLGHDDWRLPNVKELQSIVDYTRSPSTSNSAAINPLFLCSVITDEGGGKDYPFYWSGTTHANMVNGGNACYIAFGRGLGWMEQPPFSGHFNLLDVHGAGCQRSDPKTGDPADWPFGHGPQGDVIRIYNFVRLVRDATIETGVFGEEKTQPAEFVLEQNYPNPFNQSTQIEFSLNRSADVDLSIVNLQGQKVEALIDGVQQAGRHRFSWDAGDLASGHIFCILRSGDKHTLRRMVLVR